MFKCVHALMNQKYFQKLNTSWLNDLSQCTSLNHLELLHHIFVSSIEGRLELLGNSHAQLICTLCDNSWTHSSSFTSQDENNNENRKKLLGPVEKCTKCQVAFHLQCLIDADHKVKSSKSNPVMLYKYRKTGTTLKLICKDCLNAEKAADELQNEQQEIEMATATKTITPVKVNRYQLRQNKARVEKYV